MMPAKVGVAIEVLNNSTENNSYMVSNGGRRGVKYRLMSAQRVFNYPSPWLSIFPFMTSKPSIPLQNDNNNNAMLI
jgi:hypothetical protein